MKSVKVVPTEKITVNQFLDRFFGYRMEDAPEQVVYEQIWTTYATHRLCWNYDADPGDRIVRYRRDGMWYHFNQVEVYTYFRDIELLAMFRYCNKKYFEDKLPTPGCIDWAEDLGESPRLTLGTFFRGGGTNNTDHTIMRIYVLGRLKIMDPDLIEGVMAHEMLHMWEQLEMADTDDKSPLFIWMARQKKIALSFNSDKVVCKKEFMKQQKAKEDAIIDIDQLFELV